MKKLRVYEYGGCSTCRKALRFLNARKVPYVTHDITLNPPSMAELKEMLKYTGDLRKLFNTSGQVYKDMRLSEKLHVMSQEDALALLAAIQKAKEANDGA